MRATLEERFWAKVDRRGDDECWPWMAALDSGGYGHFSSPRSTKAHRYSYELLVGQIPDGLTIDHLCRNPPCVNPAHMEPVTMRENSLRGNGWSGRNARKTHCVHGHEFTAENTRISPDGLGRRICRECERLHEERRGMRKRTTIRKRGRCPICGYSFRLRKDGTVQAHYLWSGRVRLPICQGSGEPAVAAPATPGDDAAAGPV